MKLNILFALLITMSLARANVSFSESFADRLVSYSEEGETFRETISGGTFTARGKVPLTPQDANIVLGASTPVTATIGDWTFEGTLGGDPKFVAGKSKSASFKLPGGGTLRLAWGAAALTWSVTAKTGSNLAGDSFETSPVAEGLYAEESALITAADEVTVDVNLTLDTATASASIPQTGAVKYIVKTVGSGDLAEEHGLCSVKVKGSAVMWRE